MFETLLEKRRIRRAQKRRDKARYLNQQLPRDDAANESDDSVYRDPMSHKLGNLIDQCIEPFFPGYAYKRMASRQMHSFRMKRLSALSGRSYSGARDYHHRTENWVISRLSPDSALEEDLRELHERCEEMARNSTIARGAIESRVANEVGIQISPQPMVRESETIDKEEAKQFNLDMKDIYRQWSEKGVDRSRQLSIGAFQRSVDRSFATYGEAFVVFGLSPSRSSLNVAMQLISPMRVETPPEKTGDPNCVMGVQYDDDGEVVVGYWVRKRHPGDQSSFRDKDEHEYFPRFDDQGMPRMVHVFESMFPGQSRGIPWMAACINRMKDVDDMFEAELILKEVEASLGVFVSGGSATNAPSPRQQAERAADSVDKEGSRAETWSPAQITYLENDQEVSTIDPNRPGSNFTPFVEQSLRTIATALNMPFELLAKNFLRVTYSSGRLAMLDGRLGFRMRTSVLRDMFLVPLHELIVFESITGGIVSGDHIIEYRQNPHLFERNVWRTRNSGLLDPEKERKGQKIGLQMELDSRQSVLGDESVDILEREQELLEEGYMQINRQVELAVTRQKLEKEAGLKQGESLPEFSPESNQEEAAQPSEMQEPVEVN